MDDSGHIELRSSVVDHKLVLAGHISVNGQTTSDYQEYPVPGHAQDSSKKVLRLARIFLYKMLCQHLGQDFNAYGILTGMRPVKIVHRLLDEGCDAETIRNQLSLNYFMQPAKAALLTEVALANRSYLLPSEEARRLLGVYIGIPFCPSRCYYCSFPGSQIYDYHYQVDQFMNALLTEMSIMGDYISRNGWQVQTVYLGGGTPTVLNDTDLARIFEVLHRSYISSATREITIEAGRPDTLSQSRLEWLHEAGVNRICINPQTMNDDTLKLIGRPHNSQMIMDSVGWARSARIPRINMDLILGLPGENMEHFTASAEKILQIKPDNITVHTLAVKRGSAMLEAEGRKNNPETRTEVAEGVDYFYKVGRQSGYKPYYLYRQKYMKSSMENVGYALPDSFCIFNIQMIEERQTIIGLGGGASSKFVNVRDWTLDSLHNPKDPLSYVQTVERLCRRKVDKLRALN